METLPLRLSHPKDEGTLQTAKSLTYAALLTEEQLASLLDHLAPSFLMPVSGVLGPDEFFLGRDEFLRRYRDYLEASFSGSSIDGRGLTLLMTPAIEDAYAMEVRPGGYLIKALAPMIQIRAHDFIFSPEERAFHSSIHGSGAIPWGIQFSYPQIATDPKSGEVIEVLKSEACVCSPLFKKLTSWMRRETMPTPFLARGERKVATFRVGRESQEWAAGHGGLHKIGLTLWNKK